MKKTCREPGVPDVVAYYTFDWFDKTLQKTAEVKQVKPINERNLWSEAASIAGIIFCKVAKYYVNRDLCSPIN